MSTPERLTHHEHPISWQEMAERGCGGCLVVVGQYSPHPSEAVRVGVFDPPKLLAQGWMRASEVGPLAKHLRARYGERDTMYATGWSYAWTTDGGPFQLWDESGRVTLPEGILRVRAFLERSWTIRGVRVTLADGRTEDVAREEDPIALIDPTFDATNIRLEAAWARRVAEAIASAYHVPLDVDEPL